MTPEDLETRLAGRPLAGATRQRVATAYHEAGHVAAAWHLHLPVRSATIKPDATSWGHVRTTYWRQWQAWHYQELTAHREGLILRQLQVLSAGGAAEAKYSGRPNWRGCERDLGQIVDIAFSLLGADDEEAEALLRWLLIRGRRIVETEHVWVVVQAVAQALLDHETLDTAALELVVRATLRSDAPPRKAAP